MTRSVIFASMVALAPAGCRRAAAPTESMTLRVAAASDLAFAFKAVGEAYKARTGQSVTFSFGSSGLLARQIEQGAPFDVFASANVDFVDRTVAAGACGAQSKQVYGRGRIALWSRDAGVSPPASIEELVDPKYVKIAIANPAHAPYGRAAMQAFERAGILKQIESRLVFGENVQQALQYAQSGNAEVAVVAYSLALAGGGRHLLVDEAKHDPLDQAMVVCGKEEARVRAASSFAAFIASDEGRAIMARFGFALPGARPSEAR